MTAAAAAANPGRRLDVLTRGALAVVVQHADLPAGAASLSQARVASNHSRTPSPSFVVTPCKACQRMRCPQCQVGTLSPMHYAVQVTEACKQLSRCVSATAGCVSIAVDMPGALPALLRLVRCCNRSKPHAALLATALAALKPLAADVLGEPAGQPPMLPDVFMPASPLVLTGWHGLQSRHPPWHLEKTPLRLCCEVA